MVNKNPIGKIELIVEPNDKLLFKWREMKPIFSKILYQNYIYILSSKQKKGLISEVEFKQINIKVDFDLNDFTLNLSIPVGIIRPQSISLKSDPRVLKPADPASLSGYMNLYSSYLYQNSQSDHVVNEQVAVRSEMVINMNRWVLENDEEYYPTDEANDPSIKRTGTRLIHDFPSNGTRVTLGDKYTSGSYFQSTSRMLGLSIAHNYSLVSDRVLRPSASRSFTLKTPSSVEVMVDDQVVSRLNLSSGVYSLDDIPLNEGNNNITLKITDAAGKVSYIKFDVTTGLNLLAQNELKYELFLGIPSELNNRLEYFYDQPLISSYLNYGISTNWSVGANFQADKYIKQIGFKHVFASEIGLFAFEDALSMSDQEKGRAYRLVYSTFTDNSIKHKAFSFAYEHASKGFQSLGYRPNLSDEYRFKEHTFQVNYSFFNTPTFQTSLFANAFRSYDQNQFDKNFGVNFSQDLLNGQWRYNIGGQWEQTNGENGWRVNLSLTYRIATAKRLRSLYQSKRSRTRLEYTQNSSRRYVGAFNVRAGVEKNQQDKAMLDLNTQYTGNRFLTSFDHASYYQQLSAQSSRHQSRLSFSSSIAFAQNDWSVGRPIYDSFALVKAHSSLKNKKIVLGRSNGKYKASNEDFDTILLNDVSSYDHSSVTVDVDDIAPGYDIGAGIISFYPPYRSGYNIVIGSAANITVIATVLDNKKTPFSLQVGTAVCTTDKKKKEYIFFTNRKGKFALTGLMPCKYQVKLKNSDDTSFIINVEKGEQLQRKGVIYVH
ncbi:Fimbrial Usher protein [Marinomonas spartinae]|uniref:Fimbrial Usher protein n=2 Tax=Marinomonas spartinae TaxID=1792290 RepID=A0A1A8T7R7_9GAMM|nr:Fimbrial Usher protein [Marinomonas spartinae]